MSLLTIVIPCYNEEENIPRFFPELQKFVHKHGFQVIAVNDGSRDKTAEKLAEFAEDPAFTIISHKCNKGYGGALKTGLKAVKSEFAITIDSDGQHRLEDVLQLLEAVRSSTYRWL